MRNIGDATASEAECTGGPGKCGSLRSVNADSKLFKIHMHHSKRERISQEAARRHALIIHSRNKKHCIDPEAQKTRTTERKAHPARSTHAVRPKQEETKRKANL